MFSKHSTDTYLQIMARLLFIIVGVLGLVTPQVLAASLEQDEATIAHCIQTLSSPSDAERAKAARTIRKIVKKYPSETVNIRWSDGKAAFWHEKLSQIKVGMTLKDVSRILQVPESNFDILLLGSGALFGSVGDAVAQLDNHWYISVRVATLNTRRSIDAIVTGRSNLIVGDRSIQPTNPARYSGHWGTWRTNGQKWYEADYLKGEYNGVVASYRYGPLTERKHYRNGVLDGLAEEWHSNGRRASKESYRNGKLGGQSTRWYSNGRKESEATHERGVPVGLYISWYENGNIRDKGRYKQGKFDGTWIYWGEDGRKRHQSFFKDGKQEGFDFVWDDHGVLSTRHLYRDGKLIGEPGLG